MCLLLGFERYTGLVVSVSRPFSQLALVYDAIMNDVDYDDWATFILSSVRARGWAGSTVLDLGCGTGNSSYPFFVEGLKVIGVDASEEMLQVAREKLPPVQFIQADFTSFTLNEPVSLAVSVFDSLNNLLNPDDFARMTHNVYAHLESGGMFMFDVNTSIGLRDLWEANRAEGWVDDVYYHWTHSFDEQSGLAKVEAYCEKGNRSFTEVHYERPYNAPEVRTYLSNAGFKNIEILEFPGGLPARDDAERIWVLARKD